MTTETKEKEIYYLVNTSPSTQIIADLNISFPGKNEDYDSPVKSLTREQYQHSMGIQTCIADGILKEVSFEEMQELVRNRRRRTYHNPGEFEGDITGTEVTDPQFQSNVTGGDVINPNEGAALDSGGTIDQSPDQGQDITPDWLNVKSDPSAQVDDLIET